MSKRLRRIHNRDYVKACKIIVQDTMEAGGSPSDVMVVLESTITATLLFLYRDPDIARQMFVDALVPRIPERMAEHKVAAKIKAANNNGETIQ